MDTTNFGYSLILPLSPHTHTHKHNCTHPPWPNNVVPGHLQPGPSNPTLCISQLIDHCWHISNWAGIDKGQRARLRGPDTGEKPRTNIVCPHTRCDWLGCLSFPCFPCFSTVWSICLIPDRRWPHVVASAVLQRFSLCWRNNTYPPLKPKCEQFSVSIRRYFPWFNNLFYVHMWLKKALLVFKLKPAVDKNG